MANISQATDWLIRSCDYLEWSWVQKITIGFLIGLNDEGNISFKAILEKWPILRTS